MPGIAPPPPEWLSDDAREFWFERAPLMHRLGRLAPEHQDAFAMLCTEWALYRLALASVPKKVKGKGIHPSLILMRQAKAGFEKLALRFGMDPASGARLTEMSGLGAGGDAGAPTPTAEPETRDAAWHRAHGDGRTR